MFSYGKLKDDNFILDGNVCANYNKNLEKAVKIICNILLNNYTKTYKNVRKAPDERTLK